MIRGADVSDTEDISIECTFRPFDSEAVVLREVALGMQALVLMEPEVNDDDTVTFKIDATGIERAELAQILGLISKALENATDDEVVR